MTENNISEDPGSTAEPIPPVKLPVDEYTVIIDIGQATTKVGFAGDDKPIVFPTVVGKPKYKNTMAGVITQDLYVGDDTVRMRGVLKLEYPVSRGNVMDWNHYYALLNHIFYNVLRVDSSKCHVIYIVPPLTPKENAIYFARVLFETHQVKTCAIIESATTAGFSVGETTALSIDLGAGLSHVTPIMNGQIYDPSIQRLNLAGDDITHNLESLISRYGISQKREILTEIKEKACKIALDPNTASQNHENDFNFILPDGEALKIDSYVTTFAGEALFQPQLLGYNIQSLPQAVISAIRNTDPYYWRILLKKIVFSGGTALFNGLEERLTKEIEAALPDLGPLPELPEQEELDMYEPQHPGDSKQMVQITKKVGKDFTTCPKCGENITTEGTKFCPFCGEKFDVAQIEILGAAKAEYPETCPQCSAKLDGKSDFCTECGTKLEPNVVEDKLDRKEKKLLKKTAVSDKILEDILKEVEDEYGTDEELDEMVKAEEEAEKAKRDQDKNKVVCIIKSDSCEYASFKGASILGKLPRFREFMIEHAQYQLEPYSVLVEFYKVVNPQ